MFKGMLSVKATTKKPRPPSVERKTKKPKPPPEGKKTKKPRRCGEPMRRKKKIVKWKEVYREIELAKPKMPRKKFKDLPKKPPKKSHKAIEIDPEILKRCEQLAIVSERKARQNRRDFARILEERHLTNLDKMRERAINSVYFVYEKNRRMRLRERRLKRLRKIQEKKAAEVDPREVAKAHKEYISRLAVPKRIYRPPKVRRGRWKPIEQMRRYFDLAEPRRRALEKPSKWDPFKVRKSAKKYVASDIITNLALQPARYQFLEPPLSAERPVSRAALKYKMTPRMEQLYTVKVRKDGYVASEHEIGQISPNALKYKATPRILSLAKPIQR